MADLDAWVVRSANMSLNDVVAAVTPVRAFRDQKPAGASSGFFYYYSGSLFLITARSLVAPDSGLPADELRLRLHLDLEEYSQHEEYVVPLVIDGEQQWLEHPTLGARVDVIAVALDNEDVESRFLVRAFSILDQVPRDLELPLGEDVLVVGFPEGQYDEVHNLPIVRRASVASVYPVPFQGRPIGLIDGNLPDETVGAPVVTKGSPVVRKQDGQSSVVDQGEYYLVGIQSSLRPFAERADDAGLHTMLYPFVVPEIISQRAQ
jgi:hypothetical protein